MKAIVCRLGAFGDMVMVTPLFKKLKEDGYHVTLYTNERAKQVVLKDPNIDNIWLHDEKTKIEDLPAVYADLEKKCDRFINLSGSIETSLLKTKATREYYLPKDKRIRDCDVNYYDQTMKLGGYDIKGSRGELYFSPVEEKYAQDLRRKYRDKFIILWALAGSSQHKAYAWSEYVAMRMLNQCPDVMTFTTGDSVCSLLEWKHPRAKCYSDMWTIRKSMLMTKYADLVIGPETAILNAASCFDTPKIIFLSHSSEENLTKYWTHTSVFHPNAHCHPCHKLMYSKNECPLVPVLNVPLCTVKIHPQMVFSEIERIYLNWKEKKWGVSELTATDHSTKKTADCLTA